jgi:fatty-acyl-CoA synthase
MVRKLEETFGCPCYAGYGLTETSPVLTLALTKQNLKGLSKDERQRRQAMTGIPMVGIEVRVVDDDGNDVLPDGNHVGEVIARADSVMKGYWKQPEETDRVIRNGWFYTGDMGTMDEEGYLLIVDRKKDIIISGGENIASIEIELCLASHPAILECAVIAVPDPKWGEVPKALVVLMPGVQTTEADLLDHCRRHLAAYKCPRSVDFFDSLPKGGTGKILKRSMRERYWAQHESRVQG